MSNQRIFRDCKTSPEVIRPAVMMEAGYPLPLRNVEDLLHERGVDITHEAVRFWGNRCGTIFEVEIRRSRVQANAKLAEVRRSPLLPSQRLKSGKRPHQPPEFRSADLRFRDRRTGALVAWPELCVA
jgi:hypothetical protein